MKRCLGAVLSAAPLLCGATEKIVFSTSVTAPYVTADRTGFLDLLLPALFSHVGREVELVTYPLAAERGLLNANEGVDDGLALRIAGLEQHYPNLIRVPEPIAENDFVALSLRKSFATPDWSALTPYTVSHIIGWKIFEQHVPKTQATTLVRDAEQMFLMLDKGRVDVALYERWQGLAQARRMGLKVRAMEPPLVRTSMYLYLHKKHADLVPRVAAALKKVKQDGTYQRISDATLGLLEH